MASSTDDRLEEQLQLARELQASYGSKRDQRGRNTSRRGRATRTRNAEGHGNLDPLTDTARGSIRGSVSRGRPLGSATRGHPQESSSSGHLRRGASRSRTRVGGSTHRSHLVVAGSSAENVPVSVDQVPSTDKINQDNTVSDLTNKHIASTDNDSSTDQCSQNGIFPIDSRQAVVKSYPPGHGLASSYWAPFGEDYCAPFTHPEMIRWKGPSTAFLEGEDLIDLFSLSAPSYPVANIPTVAAADTTHTASQAPVEGLKEMTNRFSETSVAPSVRAGNNQSLAPANALSSSTVVISPTRAKPFKGLASSKWAD